MTQSSSDRGSGRPEPTRPRAGSGEPDAVVAGVVIETAPGQGPFVACQLGNLPDLEIVGGDGDRRLAAVMRAASGSALEETTRRLVQGYEHVLGVYPTFVGFEEEQSEGPEEPASAAEQIAEDSGRAEEPRATGELHGSPSATEARSLGTAAAASALDRMSGSEDDSDESP